MTDYPALLGALADGGVEHIIVGGLAATIHGSTRLTQDIDVVYARDVTNLELLGEIAGGGAYQDLLAHTATVELFDRPHRCLNLEWLIRTKRAAGRPRDLEAIAELEALAEEHEGTSG